MIPLPGEKEQKLTCIFFLNLNSNNESKNILLTLNFITIITITPKTSINIDQKGLFYTKTK
jgi:hypothetical protein